MTEKINFSEQIRKIHPIEQRNYIFDTDSTGFYEDDLFQRLADEAKQKYEDFLMDCFLRCGFCRDYLFRHTDEFSVRMFSHRLEKQYFWKDNLIFTILANQDKDFRYVIDQEESQNTYFIRYRAEFTGLRKDI